MKVENYKPTKSSFLSIEKDMSIIIDSIFSNKTFLFIQKLEQQKIR